MASPEAAILTRVSVSGTCFTQTTVFMDVPSSGLVALEEQSAVRAAKAERVADRVADRGRPSPVWHAVEVALGVGGLVVDGGRQHLVPDREGGDARLEPARRPEEVAGHRL